MPRRSADANPDGAQPTALEKAERLASTLGIKFNAFADPGSAARRHGAMNFLGNVDAIIFDLRDNGGRRSKDGRLHFDLPLREATHLNDLYDRNKTPPHSTGHCPLRRCEEIPAYAGFRLTRNVKPVSSTVWWCLVCGVRDRSDAWASPKSRSKCRRPSLDRRLVVRKSKMMASTFAERNSLRRRRRAADRGISESVEL